MFLSGLLIVCTSFDLAFGLHAFNMSKVYTSTVNTFSYILMFTFAVMLMIKRYSPYSFMVSVIGSFTVKVSAFFALGLLLPVIPGATGMFAHVRDLLFRRIRAAPDDGLPVVRRQPLGSALSGKHLLDVAHDALAGPCRRRTG
jgi:hypothetical protein